MPTLETIADYFEGTKFEVDGSKIAEILKSSVTSGETLGELLVFLLRKAGRIDEFADDYKDWAINYSEYLTTIVDDDTGFQIEDPEAVDKLVDGVFKAVKRDKREVIGEVKGKTFVGRYGLVPCIGTIKLDIVYEVLSDSELQVDLRAGLLGLKVLETGDGDEDY